MTDGELTTALANLGLNRSNYRAVALLPLVEVAWADGRIQRAERELIARIAQRYGLEPGDAWLERWLERRPSATLFLAVRTVLLALMSRRGQDPGTPDDPVALLALCLRVAEAAGGLFGLAFTVSPRERACIEEIASHLVLGPALPEAIVVAWRGGRRRGHPTLDKVQRYLRPRQSVTLAEAPTQLRSQERHAVRRPDGALVSSEE
ncbi:MAG TPA: TerB family tellurite resistance protein [Deltaproteobacteria bacterium]|nr:TerB family tellurite resistance protein [Deltaproteobacteria bacterium]